MASWGDRRRADAPEVVSGQASRLGVLIEAAQGNGADLLILDTAPNAAKSLRQIAAALNARGIATARGGKWEAQTVANIMRRAG